jgi:hypothetical protein
MSERVGKWISIEEYLDGELEISSLPKSNSKITY